MMFLKVSIDTEVTQSLAFFHAEALKDFQIRKCDKNHIGTSSFLK